jgi:UDP-N-acetylglucosamine 3-dehydrogenase
MINQSLKTVTPPAENSPKIALIGCGAIAEEYYLPALVRHPSVLENLILVDRDEGRTKKLAEELKAKTCLTDYRHIIEEVDGIIIAVPTQLHYPISMEFLSHGVHVLCEKPLAESVDKAKEIVECARKTKAILSVNYLQRLIPSFAKVKELLDKKILGELLSIKYFVGEEFKWPTVSGFYFNSGISSRGILRDRGAHVFDHICWWLEGKPKLVSSQNDSFGGSEAVAHIKFEHGRCTGEVKLSWLSSFPCKFIVTCEKGTIEGDVYDYRSIVLQTECGRKQQLSLNSPNKTKVDIAYNVVTNFINVIRKGEKPLISGSDVLDCIEFIDECYAAATRFNMPWYEHLFQGRKPSVLTR